MKKICLLFTLILTLIISLIGCTPNATEYYQHEPNQPIKKDSIDKHISLWNKDGSYIQSGDTLSHKCSLFLRVDNMQHSIDIESTNEKYKFKTLSSSVAVIGDKEEIGIVTISANVQKTLKKDMVEKFTNYTVNEQDKWNCYKVITESNKEIFIFEKIYRDHESGYVLEISGTNIEELQDIVNNVKIPSAVSFNPDAIF